MEEFSGLYYKLRNLLKFSYNVYSGSEESPKGTQSANKDVDKNEQNVKRLKTQSCEIKQILKHTVGAKCKSKNIFTIERKCAKLDITIRS